MRFVLLTCLLLGFAFLWSFSVPERLLVKPDAICSPDQELVVREIISRHLIMFVVSIMSQVRVSVANTKEIFEPKGVFDPLQIDNRAPLLILSGGA